VNQIPSRIVIRRAFQASFPSLCRRLWWDQVSEAPEERRMAVFKRGTPHGLIGLIPVGGHTHPISGVGAKALWKNAQKKEKKNITSESTNRIKPIFIPRTTKEVCMPRKVASWITSRHQSIIVSLRSINPNKAV